MTENERLLKRCKGKCATGEALSEVEARWLVGEVLRLQQENRRLESELLNQLANWLQVALESEQEEDD